MGRLLSWYPYSISFQYRKFHCEDKTVIRLSYLHNQISYACKIWYIYYTPCTMELLGGGIILVSLHPFVRPSHMLCPLCGLLPISWIIFICGTNKTHEGTVCCIPFLGKGQGHTDHSNLCSWVGFPGRSSSICNY